MLDTKPITSVPTSGVSAELGAISERRQYAIELWDGEIRDRWTSVYWFMAQIERQVSRAISHRSTPGELAALGRTVMELGDLLQEIDGLEIEARAQVRGMDRFIDWAKQNSRIDALLADQFRLHRAGLDESQLVAVAS